LGERYVAVDLERDQGRPHLHASGEVRRAIDRVQDPDPPGWVVRTPFLFAQDRVVGERGGDLLTQHPLDGRIGLRHEGHVRLATDLEAVAAEQPHRDLGGAIGPSDRRCALVLVHAAQPTRRSQRS